MPIMYWYDKLGSGWLNPAFQLEKIPRLVPTRSAAAGSCARLATAFTQILSKTGKIRNFNATKFTARILDYF